MRTLKSLPADSQEAMKVGQILYKQSGMDRSIVIVNDAITAIQFRRIAKTTGIDAWERYIDASARPDWQAAGLKWLTDAVDPD